MPILAEDGEVIDLRPMGEGIAGTWQQSTVPILGENGEVIALRPPVGSGPMSEWRPIALPMFNEQGNIVALPSGRCKWQQETVPILSTNGEVIALRPPASDECLWKQNVVPIFGPTGEVVALCPSIGNMKRWEQLTVPLLGENGEVIALRPSGDQFEMLAWDAPGGAAVTPASDYQLMASTGSPFGSDRTNLPLSLMRKIMNSKNSEKNCSNVMVLHASESGAAPLSHSTPRWAKTDQCGSKVRGQSGQSVFVTQPELGNSLEVDSVLISSILSASQTCDTRQGGQPGAIVPAVMVTDSAEEADTPEIHLSRLRRLAIPTTLATSPSLHSPATERTNASTDSLASIRELIRIANDARQATPEGHMMHFLQEALVQTPPGTSGSSASSLMRQGEPEVQELAARLRQLPEQWRNTILKLLEQAEAVQVTSHLSGP